MKKKILILLLFCPWLLLGQDLTMTFSNIDENYSIDSITAMNMRTNETVTIIGNETLILSSGTGFNNVIKNQFTCLAFPNPNSGNATLVVNIPQAQDISISVRNQLGQVVCRKTEAVQSGCQGFSLKLKTAGIYSVLVNHSQGQELVQIVCTGNDGMANQISALGQTPQLPDDVQLFKTGGTSNVLPYMFGDPLRFFCYCGQHETIFQDQPREMKHFHYSVDFHPCIDIDGCCYPAVEIGDQVWMAKNLAWLPDVFTPIPNQYVDYMAYYVNGYMGSSVEEAKETDNYKQFGVLYNWKASEASCPAGWRLPYDSDWKELEKNLGMSEDAREMTGLRNSGFVGMKLKSESSWFQDGNGTNLVGMNLIAGGLMEQGIYKDPGKTFWTWTAVDSSQQKWTRFVMYNQDGVFRQNSTNFHTSIAGSIRCIKENNTANKAPIASFTISPETGTNQIRYTIDATGCNDDNTPLEDLLVRWDFDCEEDPGWDTGYSNEKVFEISFPSYHKTYMIKMEVKDSEGLSNIAVKSVLVSNIGSFTDLRDGTEYKTTLIGDQVWMAENLRWLPAVSNSQDESMEDPFYYVHEYEGSDVSEAKETDNYKTYGALYNLPAAMISCPEGWRLPTDQDFLNLEDYLGMSEEWLLTTGVRSSGEVGKKLKSTWGWKDDGNGVNRYGFNILPAGYRMYSGGFSTIGEWTGIWSSTKSTGTANMYFGRGFLFDSDGSQRDDAVADFGYPVRCIKNE